MRLCSIATLYPQKPAKHPTATRERQKDKNSNHFYAAPSSPRPCTEASFLPLRMPYSRLGSQPASGLRIVAHSVPLAQDHLIHFLCALLIRLSSKLSQKVLLGPCNSVVSAPWLLLCRKCLCQWTIKVILVTVLGVQAHCKVTRERKTTPGATMWGGL